MVENRQIELFAEGVVREFHPQRIILFGSGARHAAGSESDVDLLVVMPHRGRSWEAATEIRNRLPVSFPLDLLVRSPEQIEERLAMGDPFIRDIVRNGKMLYDADRE